MNEALRAYLESYLPHTDIAFLAAAFSRTQSLKKDEFLIQPGQRADYLAFIQKGAFRVFFYNDKADEITTWFSFEGMCVADLLCYYKGTPAIYYVQAVEDSEVLIAQKSTLEQLFKTHPAYQVFGRKFAENGMVMVMERMVTLQSKSATERYLELLEQPAFLEKIPLKYLATYLGITDTSLSRIRKNLSS